MISIIMVILIDLLFLYSALYELQMLQQNSYNENSKFYKFLIGDINKNYKIYLLKYLFGVSLLLFKYMSNYLLIFYILIMIILIVNAYANYNKHNDKLLLKFTKRMLRISSLDLLFFILVQLLCADMPYTYFAGITLLFTSVNSFILLVIIRLLIPVEKHIFNHFRYRFIYI